MATETEFDIPAIEISTFELTLVAIHELSAPGAAFQFPNTPLAT